MKSDEALNTAIAALRRIERTVVLQHMPPGATDKDSCRCPRCEAKHALVEIFAGRDDFGSSAGGEAMRTEPEQLRHKQILADHAWGFCQSMETRTPAVPATEPVCPMCCKPVFQDAAPATAELNNPDYPRLKLGGADTGATAEPEGQSVRRKYKISQADWKLLIRAIRARQEAYAAHATAAKGTRIAELKAQLEECEAALLVMTGHRDTQKQRAEQAEQQVEELKAALRGAYIRLCAAHDHPQMFDDCTERSCVENRAALARAGEKKD